MGELHVICSKPPVLSWQISLAIMSVYPVADPRRPIRPCPQSGHGIHCGQLILRKISEISATRCQILRLKCTKFDFRPVWLRPSPRWGSLQRCSRPPSCISRGLLLRGGRGGKWKGTIENGKGGEGCPQLGSLDPPVCVSVVSQCKLTSGWGESASSYDSCGGEGLM